MSEIKHHPVYPNESNLVAGFNYLPDKQILEVRLQHDEYGELPYYYPNTPEWVFGEFRESESYGHFYNKKIKSGRSKYRRDYRSGEITGKVRDLLEETTEGFVSTVERNDMALYSENRELFDSIKRRRFDSAAFDMQDNSEVIRLTLIFRQELLEKAMSIITESHGNEVEWVEDCQDIVDRCTSKSDLYASVENI